MKLYTEEQITIAINEARSLEDWQDLIFTYNANEIIEKLTPIELPSDEEIKKSTPYPLSKGFYNPLYSNKWEEGAKWMRDKIQSNDKQ